MAFVKTVKLKLLMFLVLFVLSQTAYADFRKALEAYVAKDGATMLHEVQDSVEKTSDDSIELFLSAMLIDARTSRQKTISRVWSRHQKSDHFIDEDKVKTTLDSLLSEQQKTEFFSLLQHAVDHNSADLQFQLVVVKRAFNRPLHKDWKSIYLDLANKGSVNAKLVLEPSLEAAAKSGDLNAQLHLGFRYLNFTESYSGY